MPGLKGTLGLIATVLVALAAAAPAHAASAFTQEFALPSGQPWAFSRDGSTFVASDAARNRLRVYTRPLAGWGATPPAPAVVQSAQSVSGDQFGARLAISDDGATIAVSAPGGRRVHVFERPFGGWASGTYTASWWDSDVATDDIALSGDGSTLAFGAGSIVNVLLRRPGYGYSYVDAIVNAPAASLGLSRDGRVLIAATTGAVYGARGVAAYRVSGSWGVSTFRTIPLPRSPGATWASYGTDAAVSSDGTTVVISAPSNFAAVVYELASSDAQLKAVLSTPGTLPSVSLSDDGAEIAAAGAAYALAFRRPPGGWAAGTARVDTIAIRPESGSGAAVQVAPDGRSLMYGGSVQVTRFVADPTAPTTTLATSPAVPGGSNGWHVSPVTLALTADDGANGSGVVETRCALDPAAAPASFSELPPGPCPLGGAAVTATGSHVLYAASADDFGNVGAVVSIRFDVDLVAPRLQLPAAIAVDAPTPGGTTVQYTFGATDDFAATVPTVCAPAPGAFFPVGTTTVRCNAADQAGNVGVGAFEVTVRGEPLPRAGTPGGGTGDGDGGTPGGGGSGDRPGGDGTRVARPRLSGLALRGRTLSVRVSAAASVRAGLARCTTRRRGGKVTTSCKRAASVSAKATRAGTVRLALPARLAAGGYRVTVRASGAGGSATPLVKTIALRRR